jgi:hypothetical protein
LHHLLTIKSSIPSNSLDSIGFGAGKVRLLFFSPPLNHAQGKIRAAAHTKPAPVTFYGFYRARVPVFIAQKNVMGAQFYTDTAALAPLVKNKERNLGIFALLFFFSIFYFCLFR